MRSEFFDSFGFLWDKHRFLVELQVSVEVRCVLEVSLGVSRVSDRLIAELIVAEEGVVHYSL